MSDKIYKKDRKGRTEYYLFRKGEGGVMLVGEEGEKFSEGSGVLDDPQNHDIEEVPADDIPAQALENLKKAAEREL